MEKTLDEYIKESNMRLLAISKDEERFKDFAKNHTTMKFIEKSIGLIFMFKRGFGNIPMILCREAPLLGDEPRRDVADKYLTMATQAGAEYQATGIISAATQAALDAPMMPPDRYRQGANEEAGVLR